MILANATWPEVESVDRSSVVLIPTGSLEQHGHHLPLFTDSLLVTAMGTEVERQLPSGILLTPTLWLGASGHHLAFPGTLSADFATYQGAVHSVVESLVPHGFTKFFVLNGHGGNTEPNGIAIRELKAKHSNLTFGHSSYFSYLGEELKDIMKGPAKTMRHACEAETSLMMHLHPHLVRADKRRDDGLVPDPPIKGLIHHFDEMTEQGSYGYATWGAAETGKVLFELCVKAIVTDMVALIEGYVLRPDQPPVQ